MKTYNELVKEAETIKNKIDVLKSSQGNEIEIVKLENRLNEIVDITHEITFRQYMNIPE